METGISGAVDIMIKAYIQNQLKEDLEYDQMSLVEYIDPFTGEPVKKYNK